MLSRRDLNYIHQAGEYPLRNGTIAVTFLERILLISSNCASG
jgi:hypothetical protein